MFIVHELGEDEKLLGQELISKVDGGVHDARSVRSDRIGDMADVDCVQMLIIAWALNKYLIKKTQNTFII